ncbi:programmed cell death protein 2 [Plasmopara halstedii]|uniref:Programmed cell death protein 2 n=1 Tax=Plasmopara halstedii TaxID=4781 RepID=A0A0P1A734_PLAHL|nr:programmed cell death protein 2 [Plasmopara halstedii]CEG35926.1 programmed cell death protein 2 [Plasmopara halstedii]|eukprot:XP_024572295.1 programmed cell death protein 2 [Plasmopara halstedii]
MSDSDDDVSDYEVEADVELGFISEDRVPMNATPMYCEPDWTKWDGGQVGGRPSWLIPSISSIPTTEQLQCIDCFTPLSFLLQIYCPLDDVKDAFHRSLYVFVCRSNCKRQGDGKAFRLQLPKDNEFYAPTGGSMELKPNGKKRDFCALCGQRALFTCSACHVAQYCSKEHQKDHWTVGGHNRTCSQCLETQSYTECDEAREKMITQGSKWVFPEHYLEIDHEPDTSEVMNEYEAKLLADFEQTKDVEEDKMDMNVTQRELNEALGHSTDHDPQYVRFLTRIALSKDQVLRYSRWNDAVLWVHSKGMVNGNVPPCEMCGSERKFEFQILPQLLNYLNVDNESSLGAITSRSCEWGTLVVYSCTQSCSVENACVQEFLHYQPAYANQIIQ